MYIKTTHSTNSLMKEMLAKGEWPKGERFLYAGYQTAGRGQTGNSWESEEGKNLLCSILLPPDKNLHFLNIAVSVAVYRTIRELGIRELGKFQKPEVIYEDEWLMVVNKPAGMLSVPGKSEELSVESLLGAKAVHRLDQDTSGLLVLAKTPEVYKELQAYFQRRDVLKRYEALLKPSVISHQFSDEGEISLPLLPNPYDRPRQMVDREHGKVAITKYVIRERREDGTVFVDFYPLTGRTHQLRVHAAHPEGLNAPIIGDRLYGEPGNRLMLHAAEITFPHPITKKEMHFCIPSNF